MFITRLHSSMFMSLSLYFITPSPSKLFVVNVNRLCQTHNTNISSHTTIIFPLRVSLIRMPKLSPLSIFNLRFLYMRTALKLYTLLSFLNISHFKYHLYHKYHSPLTIFHIVTSTYSIFAVACYKICTQR